MPNQGPHLMVLHVQTPQEVRHYQGAGLILDETVCYHHMSQSSEAQRLGVWSDKLSFRPLLYNVLSKLPGTAWNNAWMDDACSRHRCMNSGVQSHDLAIHSPMFYCWTRELKFKGMNDFTDMKFWTSRGWDICMQINDEIWVLCIYRTGTWGVTVLNTLRPR